MKMLRKIRSSLGLIVIITMFVCGRAKAVPYTPTKSGIEAELSQAIGIVEIYPFQDERTSLRCTTFHLGDGYMATAGHCFLGSYDCNNAVVRWANSSRVSRCTNVVYSFASESLEKLNSDNRDLTIFQVDTAPEQKLKIGRDSIESMKFEKMSATGLSIEIRRGRITSTTTGPCTLFAGNASTIFGQPKPKDTVQHNCNLGSHAAGTPIIDLMTGELLAIQQSSALLPAIDSHSETYVKEIHYAKTLTELELLKIIHSEKTNLRQVSVGGFSQEVFYNGFRDKLNLKVITLGDEPGSQTISFIPHNGIDSEIEIVDGDGLKTRISGPRRANLEQRVQFKAPIRVFLKSSNTGMAPSLWLEDIEHN
ncbi:MAG: hypothetical protein RJB13_1088 [Pseudomonadota bacterium]|jgi:hypothetical protein